MASSGIIALAAALAIAISTLGPGIGRRQWKPSHVSLRLPAPSAPPSSSRLALWKL